MVVEESPDPCLPRSILEIIEETVDGHAVGQDDEHQTEVVQFFPDGLSLKVFRSLQAGPFPVVSELPRIFIAQKGGQLLFEHGQTDASLLYRRL